MTYGDRDLGPVLAPLEEAFDEVIVWDNAVRPDDLKVYGRYAAIDEARHQRIFVQDDDAILSRASLDELYQAATLRDDVVVCNMPERFRVHYTDSALVGFGAIFDRELPRRAFRRYLGSVDPPPYDDRFLRCCDVVFTALSPLSLVDVPYEEMPYAHAPTRMWKQPGHVGERVAVLEAARSMRP